MKIQRVSLKAKQNDKLLGRFIKKKRRDQRNKSETKKITVNTTEMWRIIRDYCKPLYAYKLDNLEEMDKFLETYSLPRLSSQAHGFSSGHVWMWELDYEESWVPKNWCFWTMVLEKTLVSPLDCKEIQPVHPEGDRSWVFIERNDAEAETPILWPPHEKSWLIGKDPDAGKDWRQEEKGKTENVIVGWHHRPDAHEFGWTLGVGDGQGGLACCDSRGHKESDTTERLNWTDWLTKT